MRIATRFRPPQTRLTLVTRRALISRLDEMVWAAPPTSGVIISAEAGAGKTTLVSTWASLGTNQARVGWLSLDARDADPAVFWQDVQAACEAGRPCLVIDNAHHAPPLATHELGDPLATQGLTRVVLIGRGLHDDWAVYQHFPPDALDFTADEASAFLAHLSDARLSDYQTELLNARTEGWAAGLRLAGLYARAVTAGQHPETNDLTAFAESFSGRLRYLADFFAEEAYNGLPEPLKRFLLQTAPVRAGWLAGGLADALTTPETLDGASALARLAQHNAFTRALGDGRYRYHPLFVDYLEFMAQRVLPASPKAQHAQGRAGEWFAANGHDDMAIGHLLAAGKYADAARSLYAVLPGTASATPARVLRWLDALPDQVIVSYPELCAYHAYGLAATYQIDYEERLALAGRRLAQAETALSYEDQAENGRGSQELAPLIGMLRAARRVLQGKAVVLAGAPDTLRDACASGYTEMARGRLRDAAALFRAVAGSEREAGGWDAQEVRALAHIGLADVHREWGGESLVNAGQHASAAMRLATTPDGLAMACVAHARVQLAQSDMAAATATLDKLAGRVIGPGAVRHVEACKAQVGIAQVRAGQDALEAVRAYLRAYADLDTDRGHLARKPLYETLTVARARMLTSARSEAAVLLGHYAEALRQAARWGDILYVCLLHALALPHELHSDTLPEALQLLGVALQIGATGGYVQVFLDEGAALQQLLTRWRISKRRVADKMTPEGRAWRYAGHLLALSGADGDDTSGVTHTAEMLTEREQEILGHLAAGRTYRQIADELGVALSTVKTHILAIYSKLGVESRTQAIRQAKQSGLY